MKFIEIYSKHSNRANITCHLLFFGCVVEQTPLCIIQATAWQYSYMPYFLDVRSTQTLFVVTHSKPLKS